MSQLDPRKEQILGAIVENYIKTAEPIGSRTIVKSHNFNLSPATIRNEMADLEDMGYLEQPHTSAGRIPSDHGYRYYVDKLMGLYSLTADELALMHSLMQIRITEIDKLIKEVSGIYSQMAKCAIVAVTPERAKTFIQQLQMMIIENCALLLVLVTNVDMIKTKRVQVLHSISSDFLAQLTALLNDKICGRDVKDIDINDLLVIMEQMGEHKDILHQILTFVYESLDDVDNSDVFLGGAVNILHYPEYSNIDKAQKLLEFLDNKINLKKLFAVTEDTEHIHILIGSENIADEMKDCSIITSSYRTGDNQFGSIGVIGPTRMDYSRAVSMLDFFTKQLKENL